MKLLLFIWIINVLANIESCYKKDGYVLWKESDKLRWKDFKGDIPVTREFDAASQVNLKVDYKIQGQVLKKFSVICFFDKQKSWSTTNNAEGLSHEQLHFDIGEFCARRLRKSLFEIGKKPVVISQEKVEALIDNISAELIEIQNLYDSETNHSQNKEKQKIWSKNIVDSLSSLNRFLYIQYTF